MNAPRTVADVNQNTLTLCRKELAGKCLLPVVGTVVCQRGAGFVETFDANNSYVDVYKALLVYP